VTDDHAQRDDETLHQFGQSCFYGTRSNMDVKFLARLPGAEVGDFLGELLATVSGSLDDGDATPVADVVRRWQVRAYRPRPGEGSRFAYDDGPFTRLAKPLSQCRVALISSSGHFVEGDDPEPFGVHDMTQAEAEGRISEFLRAIPTLSAIPTDTEPSQLRVRHPGYPIAGAQADPQVTLPIGHLRALAGQGVIGEVAPTAYSFVGAASQLRLRDQVAPEWAQRLHDDDADAVLLVPV
jgi:hypothetical protein